MKKGKGSVQPSQPMVRDEAGVVRFQKNEMVNAMVNHLDWDEIQLSEYADANGFSVADRAQLAQMMGYSVDGFLDLPYITDETRIKVLDTFRNFLKAERATEVKKRRAAPEEGSES